MKPSPSASTASAAAWAASKPPLLRFLDRCHADFSAETGGAVADYIPELGKADPDHFGISLATLDGHVYEVGDTRIPFTIQSMSKPFVFALALDTLGAARVRKRDRRRAVGRPLQFDPPECRQPSLQSDGQRRRHRLLRPDPRGQGRRRLRIYPSGARPVCRARTRHRRGRVCLRKRDRRPQPRDRLSPAQLLRHQGRRRRGAGSLFSAMLGSGDRARYRRHGRDAGQSRHQSRDRRTGHDPLRHLADAFGDDLFRHVRLRRRMDLSRRHPGQERRRRRHSGGAAGAARARQLLAASRQARQQRARHQGLRGAVVALRSAHAQPQRRRAQQHHRRLRHRKKSVAAQPPAA